MSTKGHDFSFAVGRGFSNQTRHESTYGWWEEGEAVTPYGIVTTYRDADCCRLRFVIDGRLHSRSWLESTSKLGIRRRAFAFAREIAERD